MSTKVSAALLLLVLLPFGTSAQAAIITFDFLGTAGSDLDELSTGSTSATVGGITLTLNAVAQVAGNTGEFNQNGVTPDDFGINAGGADASDALDGQNGVESILFSISSSEPLSALTLDSFDFDRITPTGMDSGSLTFDGGSTITFDNDGVSGNDVLTVNESLALGQNFTLSFVAGNGFGLETLTLTATAVPEPSSLLALSCVGLACVVRLRRKSHQAKSATL